MLSFCSIRPESGWGKAMRGVSVSACGAVTSLGDSLVWFNATDGFQGGGKDGSRLGVILLMLLGG